MGLKNSIVASTLFSTAEENLESIVLTRTDLELNFLEDILVFLRIDYWYKEMRGRYGPTERAKICTQQIFKQGKINNQDKKTYVKKCSIWFQTTVCYNLYDNPLILQIIWNN